jgi:hypothetical protein
MGAVYYSKGTNVAATADANEPQLNPDANHPTYFPPYNTLWAKFKVTSNTIVYVRMRWPRASFAQRLQARLHAWLMRPSSGSICGSYMVHIMGGPGARHWT